MLEPRARNVDAELMMESLFRLSELEIRFPLNMNVLVGGLVPKVVSLGEALLEWLDHRRDVLLRRSRHRLSEIEHRLEVLGGYLIAYLNLDEVIRIIREEDEPKPVTDGALRADRRAGRGHPQYAAALLRKLEEFEIRKEHDALSKEKDGIEKLLGSEARQWKTIAWELGETRKRFAPDTDLGRRRTGFGEAAAHDADAVSEAMIEREPITVVVSEKGWIRALKGHVADQSTLAFKGDDALKLSFFAETTSKLLVFATNGRFYTLDASKLPGGRGHGEPLRLSIDLEQDAELIAVFVYQGGRKLLVAAKEGRGFVVAEDDCIANTRKGKQVLGVDAQEACAVVPAMGDTVAVIGDNRKLLLFPLTQIPEMARGRGVRLQRYKDGGLADVKVFSLADGLTWTDTSGRTWTVNDLTEWRGERAGAGRLPPKGFPRNNRFG